MIKRNAFALHKISLLAGLIGAVMFNTVSAADLTGVTKTAIENNPEVQIQWQALQEAIDGQKQAKGAYLPSIDVNAAYGKGRRDFDRRGWFDQGQAEISLTQVLFDGFRVQSRVAQGDYTALSKYYELSATIEQKTLDASQAYLDIQRYRDLVTLAKENYATHQRVYQQIQQRANQGVGNKADFLQISGRLSLAQSNLLTEQANLNDVTARYQTIVGEGPALDLQPVQINAALPASQDELLAASYQTSPVLHARLSDIEFARANAAEFKSNLYPKLSFVARHGLYENRNSFDERANSKDYGQDTAVELRLNYNLFNGGTDKAAYRAAQGRLARAGDIKSKACSDVKQAATVAWNNVENINSKLSYLKQHRDDSALVVKAYDDQFDIGRRTLLDVLDSENEAFQANRAYISAQYDLKISQLQALSSAGQLLPALGIQRDNLPQVADISDREINSGNVCSVQAVNTGR